MMSDPSHRHGYDRDSLLDWRKALPPNGWAAAWDGQPVEVDDAGTLIAVELDDDEAG